MNLTRAMIENHFARGWFLNVHPELGAVIVKMDAPGYADSLRRVGDFDRHDLWRCIAAGSIDACKAAQRLLT